MYFTLSGSFFCEVCSGGMTNRVRVLRCGIPAGRTRVRNTYRKFKNQCLILLVFVMKFLTNYHPLRSPECSEGRQSAIENSEIFGERYQFQESVSFGSLLHRAKELS